MALREWQRVLRPGGRVILVEGDWRRPGGVAQADYAPIVDQLPLYGGRPAAELADLAGRAGLVDVFSEPLTEADLWGGTSPRERYALHASRATTT